MKNVDLYIRVRDMYFNARGKPWESAALNYLRLVQRRLKRNNHHYLVRTLEVIVYEREIREICER